jgi:dTDP-4-amino-4,6-dideoxygalactose transaminase
MYGELAINGGQPVRKDFLVFGNPAIEEAEIKEVEDTLRSGWLGTGPKTSRFEEDFKNYIGCKHAIAVNSCTAGLHLALDAIGVRRGDEVITSPMTFASTANVIVHLGAKPVFVDIDRATMNIDPSKITQVITSKTKAIIPVHMAGHPCRMDQIIKIAKDYNIAIVEDAAHAIEAQFKGMKVGNIGDITAFSFYVTKNVCTGEGGMVTTNNDAWADEMRIKRLHGLSRDAWKRYSTEGFKPYDVIYAGYKYNMTDIQASLGIHQLARVEKNLDIRKKYWAMYNEAFSDMPELIIPSEETDVKHARHLYTLLINPDVLKIDREYIIRALKAENIGTGVHFVALHLHKFYRETFGFKRGDYPNAEFVSDNTFSLPLSAKLSEKDVQDVIFAVKKIVSASQKNN